jgi:CheY-like chemotaxis protein
LLTKLKLFSTMKKILIVDDEEDITASVKMLVEGMGYSSKIASGGLDALKALNKEKFDLVLLDIMMPQMSGREVLEKIRADSKLKNTPVAFLTAIQLGSEGTTAIKKLKVLDYFQKPIVDIDDFKRRLKKLLA